MKSGSVILFCYWHMDEISDVEYVDELSDVEYMDEISDVECKNISVIRLPKGVSDGPSRAPTSAALWAESASCCSCCAR
jgi:hypothetical protein